MSVLCSLYFDRSWLLFFLLLWTLFLVSVKSEVIMLYFIGKFNLSSILFNCLFIIADFIYSILSLSFCLTFCLSSIETLIRHGHFWGHCLSFKMATGMWKSSMLIMKKIYLQKLLVIAQIYNVHVWFQILFYCF